PAARYATAGQLLQDLRGVREALRFGRPLDTLPEPQPEPAQSGPTPPIIRQRPTPVAARPPVDTAGEPATRTLVLGMVAALVLLAAGFFLIQWMFLSAPKDVTVPNVLKLDETEARQKLLQAGLGMDVVSRDYSEQYPQDTVYRMYPLSGESVKQGKSVRV